MEKMETEWKLGNSGQISYMNALIYFFFDSQVSGSVSSSVLQNFSVVEMFIRRATRCITKKMRMLFSKRAATSDPLSFAKIQESD